MEERMLYNNYLTKPKLWVPWQENIDGGDNGR